MTKSSLKPSFDFISSNELPYSKRDAFSSGDSYGIGQAPKQGKMRASFVGIQPPSKEDMKPPIRLK